MSDAIVFASETAEPNGTEEDINSPTFPDVALSFVFVPGNCPATLFKSEVTKVLNEGVPDAMDGAAKILLADCDENAFPSINDHPGTDDPICKRLYCAAGLMPNHPFDDRYKSAPTVFVIVSKTADAEPAFPPVRDQRVTKNEYQSLVGASDVGSTIATCGVTGTP